MTHAFKTKSEIVASLRVQLSNRPSQALKALVILFNRQTTDEKMGLHTRHVNFVGFSHRDSVFLTSLAKQYINKGSLTTAQMVCLHRIIPRYAGQLIQRAIDLGIYRKEKGMWVY